MHHKLIIAAAAVSSLMLLAWAYFGYPVPYTDSIIYLPTAINFASGKGFINEVCNMSYTLDPLRQTRFVYTVPLFPMGIAALMPSPDARGAFMALAGLFSSVILLFAFMVRRILNQHSQAQSDALAKALGFMSIFSLSTIFVGHGGSRPENLGIVWFTLSLWLHFRVPEGLKIWVHAVTLGLMGATFPVGAIFSAVLILGYYAITQPWADALIKSTLVYVGSSLVFLAALALGPYPIAEVLMQTAVHGQNALRPRPADMITAYFLYANAFMIGVIVLLSTAIGLISFFKYAKHIKSRWLLAGASLLMLFCFYRFSICVSNRPLNLLFMAPLLYLTLVNFGVREIKQPLFRIILLILISLPSINYFRTALLFPYYLKEGLTLKDLRAEFQAFQKEHPQITKIGVSDSLWVVSEDYYRMIMCQANPIRCAPDQKDLAIFWHQSGSGQLTPSPNIEGYALIRDRYSKKVPTFFGLPLSHSMPGYFYALYADEAGDVR